MTDDYDRRARTLDDGSDAGGYIVPPAMLAAYDALLTPAPAPPGGDDTDCMRGHASRADCNCHPVPGGDDGAAERERERLVELAWDGGHGLVVTLESATAALAAARHEAEVQRLLRDAARAESARLAAALGRWGPITSTYHAVVAGEHLDACIACLMVAELREALPAQEMS